MAASIVKRYLSGTVTLAILAAVFWMAYGTSCDHSAGGNVQAVKVGGEWFHLEVAADDATRMKGLGGRTQIDKDGGMLFVFDKPHQSAFVMRDCPVDIDILYLSPEGRVLSMYAMKAEPPRKADGSEGQPGTFDNEQYEGRLKKYDSRYPLQFAIELRGGRLAELKVPVKEGDKIDLPVEDLKKRAK